MVAVLVLAPLALVGALFPSFSLPATVYVLAVGGVLACLGLSGRLAPRTAAGPLPAPAGPVPEPRPAPLAETPADAALAAGAGPDPGSAAGPGGVLSGSDAEPDGVLSGSAGGPGGGVLPGSQRVPATGPESGPVAGADGGTACQPTPRRLSPAAAWWLVPALLLGAIELTDLVLGSAYPHPTLSVLLDPVLDHYPARAVAYFGWLAAFWGLVRR